MSESKKKSLALARSLQPDDLPGSFNASLDFARILKQHRPILTLILCLLKANDLAPMHGAKLFT